MAIIINKKETTTIEPISTEEALVEYTFKDGSGNEITTYVTEEVMEVLHSEKREERRYAREFQRRGSYFSVEDKYVVDNYFNTSNFEDELLTDFIIEDLMKFLDDNVTKIQKKRFVLHRINEISFEQIARVEGCGKVRIKKSVDTVDEKIKKFFQK